MEFGLQQDERDFQQEVRSFLEQNFDPSLRQREGLANSPERKAFIDRLADRGWLGLGWPEEHGGSAAPPLVRILINEELAYSGAPNIGIGVLSVGQSIMRFGSTKLKQDFLPWILRNEILFAYGYTEPHAGSDLASLRTLAVRDGDEYVVNGLKRFITPSHYADYLFAAVRTDPSAERHAGISVLLIPLDTPGIKLEEIRTLGEWRTNEITLNDVRVPSELLVGEPNQGWEILTSALSDERLMPHATLRRTFDDLVAFVRPQIDQGSESDRSRVIGSLVRLATLVQASYMLFVSQADAMVQGRESQALAAMHKLYLSEIDLDLMNTTLDLLGPAALVEGGSPSSIHQGIFVRDYRASPLGTIGGGTSEVQRNLIARRELKLPRSS